MRIPAVFLALAVAGCVATNPATGRTTFSLVGSEQARKIGEETIQSHLKTYGLYKESPALEKYYKKLGQKIYGVSELKNQPAEFLMFDSETYNAFATPGFISTFRGLLPYLNSEAELAGVLAHEAGHLNALHIQRGQTSGIIGSILVQAGAIAVGTSTNSQQAADLAVNLGGAVAQVTLSGFSREYEREADELALRYMGQAGYDPREILYVFKSFEALDKFDNQLYSLMNNGKKRPRSSFYHLLTSHPEPTERQENTIQAVGRPDGGVVLPNGVKPATPANDPQGRARYFKMIDGLAYGPKIKAGIAGRYGFYDPEDRFIWRLPEGLFLNYEGSGWEGVNPVDKTRLLMGGLSIKKGKEPRDPEEALRGLYPMARNVERIDVDGRLGYTGTFNPAGVIDGMRGYARMIILPSGKTSAEEDRVKHFIGFLFVTANTAPEHIARFDANIRSAMDNLAYLSVEEAKTLEPLRLKIHTVQAGETLDSLAEKMAAGALRKEWFMALNGLTGNDPLIPGMQVKLIVDPNASVVR
jgi:predicted Zn-dependent protease